MMRAVGRGKRRTNDLAQTIEDKADVPVLVAALTSVPAVFLTMTSGVWAVIGTVLNTASGITLIGESVLLLLVSGERLKWIREHRGELGVRRKTVHGRVPVPVELVRVTGSHGVVRRFPRRWATRRRW